MAFTSEPSSKPVFGDAGNLKDLQTFTEELLQYCVTAQEEALIMDAVQEVQWVKDVSSQSLLQVLDWQLWDLCDMMAVSHIQTHAISCHSCGRAERVWSCQINRLTWQLSGFVYWWTSVVRCHWMLPCLQARPVVLPPPQRAACFTLFLCKCRDVRGVLHCVCVCLQRETN